MNVRLASLICGALVCLAACQAPSPPPEGGETLVPAIPTARFVAVGTVRNVRAVDVHGYAADFAVESVLDGSPAPSGPVVLLWEELATARPVRFRDDDRIVAAIVDPPGASIWRERAAKTGSTGRALSIANSATAFRKFPNRGDLDRLRAYVAVPVPDRRKAIALPALTALFFESDAPLSTGAAQVLSAILADGEAAPETLITRLAERASDRTADARARSRAFQLLGATRSAGAAELVRKMIADGTDRDVEAWEALAKLPGGIQSAEADRLRSSDSAPLRVLGVRNSSASAHADFVRLVRTDPEASVRVASVNALADAPGTRFEDLVGCLTDESSSVRLAAAHAVAKLGESVVPRLEALARNGGLEEAFGAILSLDAVGPAARPALERLAHDDPRENVRNTAMLSLGRIEGHKH